LGGKFNRLNRGIFFERLNKRLGIVQGLSAVSDNYVAGSVAQFHANLFVESVHNALGSKQPQNAKRYPQNRHRRKKRHELPRREEMFKGNVQPPFHLLFGTQAWEQNSIAYI